MKLKLEIKAFQLEEGFDFIKIGNGHAFDTAVIWRGTGTTNIRVIFSNSDALWIKMESDLIIGDIGFAFYIKSVSSKYVLKTISQCSGVNICHFQKGYFLKFLSLLLVKVCVNSMVKF